MAKAGVTSVLAGARTPEQVARNVRSAQLSLPGAAIARLDQATDALKHKLGPNADYFQGQGDSRIQ
jgi:aryl-alcohol dehydrogenase-like predicted oxidoreductase